MTPEQADILFELDGISCVEGVYEILRAPSPEWPTVLVVMRSEAAYDLGVVTTALLRALPDRARHHVGVVASDRLRELLVALGNRLDWHAFEREAAKLRALAREEERAAQAPPPIALPAAEALRRDVIWRLSSAAVFALEVVGDPFRIPVPSPRVAAVRVVALLKDQVLTARIERRLGSSGFVRVTSVDAAVELIGRAPMLRTIVCGESFALGDDGLLARLAAGTLATTARVFVICAAGSAEWVESYARAAVALRVHFEEEPLDDEALGRMAEG